MAEIIAANPGITALGAGFNQGSGNGGLVSAVDLLQVGATTYNFERNAPLIPEPPKPGHPDCDAPKAGHGQDHPGNGGHDKGGHDTGDHDKGGHDPAATRGITRRVAVAGADVRS